MSESYSVLSQFETEMENWKKIVVFIQDENILLKNRLSGMLKDNSDSYPVFMERIEYFHDLLLKEDEITIFLRHEINHQKKMLERELARNGTPPVKQISWLQKKLGNMVLLAAQNFNKLKIEFNNYLGELLLYKAAGSTC